MISALLAAVLVVGAATTEALPSPLVGGPPFVGGYERFYRGEPAPSRAGGLLLLGELGCVACHEGSPRVAPWLHDRPAPRLAQVATRIDPQQLERRLGEHSGIATGTVMPDLLAQFSEDQRRTYARAIVHYLVSRSDVEWTPVPPDRVAVADGERLYHEIGCVACHQSFRRDGAQPIHSQPLSGAIVGWTQPALARFLRDPQSVRPAGRMPSLGLDHREAQSIAHYLLRDTVVVGPLEIALDRGHRKSFDQEGRSRPHRTGLAASLALPTESEGNDVTTHLRGFLRIDEPGEYEFHLVADDLGRLTLDGTVQIDLEGELDRRNRREGKARVTLAPGWHEIAVDHFQWVEEALLELEWQGPGIERGAIPPDRLRSERSPPPALGGWRLDPAAAAIGERFYSELGCASCHEAERTITAPPLADLDAGEGCLGEREGPYPQYRLDARQRGDLAAALTWLQGPAIPAPSRQERIRSTLVTFQCTSCHERKDFGGVPLDRRDFFEGSDPALGDEGRIPPTLTGVGDKLRREWLEQVIGAGGSVRPYVSTRMPRFDLDAVGHLVDDFIAEDRHPSPLPESIDSDEIAKEAGRTMSGTGSLQCILCHDFNRRESVGLRAMDLATITERLHPDWFHRYMLDPESLRPGTQMPALWPGGRTLLPDLLGGDPDRQVAAIWRYLEDGPRAVFPEGLSRQQLELFVGGEAITYRGKLWEAGFRAIAVGLPEGSHYAFNAEEVRLSLLWKGRFLNVAGHWQSQGMGRVRPLGNDVVVLPHGAEIARLEGGDDPWPEPEGRSFGLRFAGYRLGEQRRPTFLYQFENVEIEDEIVAVEGASGTRLVRTVTLASENPPGDLWWRLAEVDGVQISVEPRDGARGGPTRIPIRFQNGRATLQIEYQW